MNDKPPAYSFHNNFETSSAAISTISGSEAYNRRNPSGKKPSKKAKLNPKRPIESDPHLCTDLCGIIRSKFNCLKINLNILLKC